MWLGMSEGRACEEYQASNKYHRTITRFMRDASPALHIFEGCRTLQRYIVLADIANRKGIDGDIDRGSSSHALGSEYTSLCALLALRNDVDNFILHPWIVKSIFRGISGVQGEVDNHQSSQGLPSERSWQQMRPIDQELQRPQALLNRSHGRMGLRSLERCVWKCLHDAHVCLGTILARCQSNQEKLLQHARPFVRKAPLTTLLTICLLGHIPHIAGAPVSPGDVILKTTHDIESFMDAVGSMAITLAPYSFVVAGAARLVYIWRRSLRKKSHPVYSGTLSIFTAFGWWAVRVTQQESAKKEAAFLAAFFACYASFVADSRRSIREKKQYVLSILFLGTTASLLATALQALDSGPMYPAPHGGAAYLNHSQTSEVGSYLRARVLRSEEATTFLTRAANNGPFWWAATAIVIYMWQSYTEVKPGERLADRAGQQ